MLNLFSFHLISSRRSFSWKLLTASHCHRSLCHPISSSQLLSCLLSFFSSSQLFAAHVVLSQRIHFLRNQLALLWYFVVVHLMSKHLISHQFFLHLPFSLFPKPNKTPQQLFPCIRHEKFRVVVSAVSDPWVRWDTHSKPSRSEAPNYTERLLRSKAFTHSKLSQRILYTQKLLHTANFHTRPAFIQSKLTQRSFHTEKLLHTEAFTHSQLLHREAFTQS